MGRNEVLVATYLCAGKGVHVHVHAAKGVVRMWRTSGQELPSPFPDDASLAADKVCESKLALCDWKPPTSPLRRDKKTTLSLSNERTKISPTVYG